MGVAQNRKSPDRHHWILIPQQRKYNYRYQVVTWLVFNYLWLFSCLFYIKDTIAPIRKSRWWRQDAACTKRSDPSLVNVTHRSSKGIAGSHCKMNDSCYSTIYKASQQTIKPHIQSNIFFCRQLWSFLIANILPPIFHNAIFKFLCGATCMNIDSVKKNVINMINLAILFNSSSFTTRQSKYQCLFLGYLIEISLHFIFIGIRLSCMHLGKVFIWLIKQGENYPARDAFR